MKFINYIKDCVREMKRVSWPNKKEVFHTTRVVLISTVVVALILGAVDLLLLNGVFLIFGMGR